MKKHILLLLGVLLLMPTAPAAASSLSTTIRSTPGTEPWWATSHSKAHVRVLSDDGRYMAIDSLSNELIPGYDGGFDLFLYDRLTKKYELIYGIDGQPLEGMSMSATYSGDGRYLTFLSYARNGAPGLTWDCDPTCLNLYIYDMKTKKLTLNNLDSAGNRIATKSNYAYEDQPVLNHDGRYLAFRTTHPITPRDTNQQDDLLLRDLKTGTNRPISVDSFGRAGAGHSLFPTLSADGRYVSFTSRSPFVAEDQNQATDIYLRDMELGKTTLISKNTSGKSGNGPSQQGVMSQDGRYIAYASWASDLVAGDTNHKTDVFLYSVADGTTRRVSVGRDGQQGNDSSGHPDISRDGRYVVYSTYADNLIKFDTNRAIDTLMYYRDYNLTRLISRASHDGVPGNGNSSWPSISGDGKTVFFYSSATNISGETGFVPESQMYINHNPVVDIPFYDPVDFMEVRW